ncbi:MAG TPA: marine proteobacterial sortase target protein, partial [Kiloniellaceae bacterium]|nr:marine proteobacterial sortase target protein [Kiloniellaceae bacterium]
MRDCLEATWRKWNGVDSDFQLPGGVFPPVLRRVLKRNLQQILLSLLLGLLLLTTLALLAPGSLRAAPTATPTAVASEQVPAGLFFNAGDPAAAFEAPLLKSDVTIEVNGLVSRVKVRQAFLNPSEIWLEGTYVFPLPDRSAVDRMTLVIGDRRIDGEIMEKADARKAYQAAAAAGQRASLLSAERPNVFTTAVANVGPGESVVVEIEYQDAVSFDAGLFSLRFPMVVAPRYSPPATAVADSEAAPGISATPAAAATGSGTPYGSDLFGPVRHPDDGPINPVSLTVHLNAGLALESLQSRYHDVSIESAADGGQIVTLQAGAVPADRDFLLEWRPHPSSQPQAALFAEEVDGSSHLMLMLLPPDGTAATQDAPAPQPRDMIFVIDSSGSMHGPSIEQAKGAVLAALERLGPQDRFNVIRFNNDALALFETAAAANDANLMKAWYFVKSLRADGGTNMRPALEAALAAPAETGRLRQVVFVTDGAVSNEAGLFTLINNRLADTRLFTVGIGSAPNSYFMRKAAETGRGSFVYIGDVDEVGSRMAKLFRKLESPALTGIDVAWQLPDGRLPEVYPQPLPDLYAGEPVVLNARLDGLPLAELTGSLRIAGQSGAEAWSRALSLDSRQNAPGVAALWARAKLDRIEDGLQRGETPDLVRAKALEVALSHDLVTRYTSLVAIDAQVVRPKDAGMASGQIERNLPAGWSYEHVFGEAAKHMQLRKMPAGLQKTQAGQAIGLPRGATPARF